MSKRSLFLLLLLLSGILAVAILYNMKRAARMSTSSTTAPPPPTQEQIAWATARAEFLAYLRRQPGIKDAIYTDQNWLQLGVSDDGTDWNTYASSICKMLVVRGVSGVAAVKIVDIVKVTGEKSSHELGQSSCR